MGGREGNGLKGGRGRRGKNWGKKEGKKGGKGWEKGKTGG